MQPTDGPVLFQRAEMTAPVRNAVARGEAVAFTTRSPDKTTPNEDAFALVPVDEDCAVLVVADGLGSVRSGDEAASLAVQRIAEAIGSLNEGDAAEPGRLRTAILDGIESANRSILDLGIGAATTIAVVEISPGQVRPYHVGDSMILVTGQRGKLKLLTVSHSPVGMAIESGLLDAEEAMHHVDRHIVNNVVGCDAMRIEIGPAVPLATRDTVVIASDGLSDNLHTEEIIALVRKGPLAEAVERVAQAARERMTNSSADQPRKPDDLTIVAYRPSATHRATGRPVRDTCRSV